MLNLEIPNVLDQTEEWRPCFDGDYEVSSLGRVRRVTGGRGAVPGRILRPGLVRGYPAVVITHSGRRGSRYVHHIVAHAFLGPRGELSVNHIDGNKQNPALSNLEYCSHQENMAHASATGLLATGRERSRTKLCECAVRAARRLRAQGVSLSDVGRRLGVSAATILDIEAGRTWRGVA